MDQNSKDTNKRQRFRRLRYYRLYLLRKLRRFAPHHSLHWALIIMIIVPTVLVYGCSFGAKSKKPKPSAVPVVTTAVVTQNVPIYISALGTVTPVDTVTVNTQINGQLLKVYFKDGQMIQAGDLLAEVDPRPYQALLLQYQGDLIRDKALLANARIDLERYKTLYAQDSISQQTLATQQSLVDQYIGAVQSDIGQIQTVKVNLIYCRITSPITGRLGLITVDPGNIVQTTDTTGIVIINTMDPIYVDFAIPEDNLPEIAQKMATGKQLTVYAQDRTQHTVLAAGYLKTTDNQINTSTGTIMLRAVFANANNMLFPNQFVNIQLQIDELQDALVVPTEAIQYGTNGNYLFVLNSNMTVSMKNIKVLSSMDDTTAISGDLKAGDKVVTEGTDNVKDGTLVTLLQPTDKPGTTNSEPV